MRSQIIWTDATKRRIAQKTVEHLDGPATQEVIWRAFKVAMPKAVEPHEIRDIRSIKAVPWLEEYVRQEIDNDKSPPDQSSIAVSESVLELGIKVEYLESQIANLTETLRVIQSQLESEDDDEEPNFSEPATAVTPKPIKIIVIGAKQKQHVRHLKESKSIHPNINLVFLDTPKSTIPCLPTHDHIIVMGWHNTNTIHSLKQMVGNRYFLASGITEARTRIGELAKGVSISRGNG